MNACMIPERSGTDEDLAGIFKRTRTVAVVGISHREERDSHRVAKYLKEHGYRIIPVNPKYQELLGEKCYPDLRAVPGHIDVVDIFRNVEFIPGIVDEAISVGAGCVWMQHGLSHEEAGDKARCAGIAVVMNRCMMETHHRINKDSSPGFQSDTHPADPAHLPDSP